MSINDSGNDTGSLYEILDINSNASPQDVREAYYRTKATYSRSNVALYSLVNSEEREEILKKIEEAYNILSSPEKRKEYDSHFGIIGANDHLDYQPEQVRENNIVSIDRVPPMESGGIGDDMLIPPSTDFPTHPETGPILENKAQASSPTPSVSSSSNPRTHVSEVLPSPYQPHFDAKTYLPKLDPSLLHDIEIEQEWRGAFLKKIREAYKMSLEEICGITKVSRTYIVAIEDENFAKLPAPVYIRGFVSQIAKVLKLPHEKVANAYLARYRLKRPSE